MQYIEKSLACLSFIIVHAWNVFHRGGFHLGSKPLFLKPSIIKLQAFMVFPFSRLWFQSLIIKSLQHLFQQEISNKKKAPPKHMKMHVCCSPQPCIQTHVVVTHPNSDGLRASNCPWSWENALQANGIWPSAITLQFILPFSVRRYRHIGQGHEETKMLQHLTN